MNYYTNELDTILRTLYTATLDFLICGDINISYLIDSARKNQLDTLLFSCNLSDIIKFPTRVQINSVRAIDNILIVISQMGNCTAIPMVFPTIMLTWCGRKVMRLATLCTN